MTAQSASAEMDRNGIDVAVMSSSPALEELPEKECVYFAKKSNDAVAELIRKFPGRFFGAAVLPWQVGEALDGLHLAAVEVDGVGVLGYGDAVGCVPDGLGFAIDEVAGVLAGFLAAASQNGDGDELHLFEGACDAHVGVLGVPDGDGAAIAHIDGLAGVELGTAFGRS